MPFNLSLKGLFLVKMQPLIRFLFLLSVFSFSSFSNAKTLIFQSQDENTTQVPLNAGASDLLAVSSEDSVVVDVRQEVVKGASLHNQSQLSAQVNSGNSELFFMLEQLQLEMRELRGLLEEQANQIRHIKRNGKSRYRDIDSRVLGLSKKVSVLLNSKDGRSSSSDHLPVSGDTPLVGVAGAKSDDKSVDLSSSQGGVGQLRELPSQEQKQLYQQAFSLIKDKRYEDAVKALHSFIERFPDGKLAGNAYYWLGEVYLVLPKLEQAKQAFTIVVSSFSSHGKVADAYYKLGVTYDRLQDPEKSEKYLIQVQEMFPASTAAKLAKNYNISR
mgnify:CR=1 FL=1